MRFEKKVAFITGGARGIGEIYARALAAEGASVVLADIDKAAADETATAMRASGANTLGVQCDVGDEKSIADAVDQAVRQFGGVDILINNAARHLQKYAQPPTKLSLDEWRIMLNVNVVGIVACSVACRESMRKRGGGVIINQSSIAARTLNSAYGMSKLAVQGLTVALSQELAADNIRVNCIAPGIVDSPAAVDDVPAEKLDMFVSKLQLIKRRGRMTDLTGALLYFCSDEASFVTGETLFIGGGYPPQL